MRTWLLILMVQGVSCTGMLADLSRAGWGGIASAQPQAESEGAASGVARSEDPWEELDETGGDIDKARRRREAEEKRRRLEELQRRLVESEDQGQGQGQGPALSAVSSPGFEASSTATEIPKPPAEAPAEFTFEPEEVGSPVPVVSPPERAAVAAPQPEPAGEAGAWDFAPLELEAETAEPAVAGKAPGRPPTGEVPVAPTGSEPPKEQPRAAPTVPGTIQVF